MDGVQDLRSLFASHHVLIVAGVDDEERFMGFARRAAELCGFPVWTWSITRGLARDGHPSQVDTSDAKKALGFVAQLTDPAVFVFHDALSHMEDAVVVRATKEIALAATWGQTIVLTGPRAVVPAELDGLALVWTLEPPAREEIEPVVRRTMRTLAERGLIVDLDQADVDRLVTASMGLTLPEIERLIVREAIDDQRLDGSDVDAVRRAKADLLADDGVLQLIATDLGLDEVGGLEVLKRWLAVRARGSLDVASR